MNTAASFARREWGPLYTTVRAAAAARGWRAVPLTLASVSLIALFQIVQNQSWGHGFVQDAGFVRARDPLWPALLRTPTGALPLWWDMAIIAVFSLLIYFWAQSVRLPDEETQEYIGSVDVSPGR
ncbi:hypothetical protein [Streptomyces jumonjinensis]|uniref:Uncharacterized protein n=1 Tax=Streptomyces jumonjinensis TaxID=1945 RepID=A0A646KPG1_STRJU|nr:hypothetical protein [Streptomyces jumonjinensis]MQT04135.1 hypothetical protein [Streptomyces jumonjinensis]